MPLMIKSLAVEGILCYIEPLKSSVSWTPDKAVTAKVLTDTIARFDTGMQHRNRQKEKSEDQDKILIHRARFSNW